MPNARTTSTRRRQTHERDRGGRGHHPLVRRDARPARRRSRRTRRWCRRAAGTERGGQDDARSHPVDADRTRQRDRPRRGLRRGEASRPRCAACIGTRGPVRRRRRDAHRSREPRDGGSAVAPVEEARGGARGRGARARQPHRRGRSPAQDLLRWHAPTHRPRCRARRPPPGAPARRTDHRPRPRQPARPLGLPARPRRTRARPSSSPRSTWRRPTSSRPRWW